MKLVFGNIIGLSVDRTIAYVNVLRYQGAVVIGSEEFKIDYRDKCLPELVGDKINFNPVATRTFDLPDIGTHLAVIVNELETKNFWLEPPVPKDVLKKLWKPD
jgi:hypothetical protein